MDVPVLLDVDGVINVLPRYDLTDRALGRLRSGDVVWPTGVDEHVVTNVVGAEVTVRISHDTPALVARLAALGPIVWCSGWGQVASDVIAPLVGLPPGLPCVPLPDRFHGDGPQGFPLRAPFVRLWASDHGIKRLLWLDDNIYGAERYLAAAVRAPGQVLDAEACTGAWRDDWRAIAAHTPPLVDVVCIQVNAFVGLNEQVVGAAENAHRALSEGDA